VTGGAKAVASALYFRGQGDETGTEARKARTSGAQAYEDNVILRLAQIAARIPPQELAKLPADGSKNVDRYVYGTPKEEA
jgi:hypothetical protein